MMKRLSATMKLNAPPVLKKFDIAAVRAQADALKKRFQVRSALGVSIEAARIVVELVQRDEGRNRVLQSFALPFGADAVLSGAEKVGQELAAQLEILQLRERRCAVTVPTTWAMTLSMDLPDIPPEDLQSFFELRAEREFPISVSDLRLAHSPFTLPDGTRRATLAGIPVKRLEAVDRMLARAGCKAVSVSLGLTRCLTRAGSPGALHFLTDADRVDVAVTAGGGIVALRTLPTAAAVFPEVRITLGRLPEALRQQVREAWFTGLPASAEKLFGEISAPLQRLGIESRVDPTDRAESGSGREAAEYFLQQRPPAFEFVIPQVNKWMAAAQHFEDPRRRWIAGAVIGLILLPILLVMWRSSKESRLNARWTAMSRTVTDLDDIQHHIRRYRPWFDTSPRSLKILDELADAFPEGGEVWAKSIELSETSKITCTGFARNQGALASMLDKLRKRSDVSEVQLASVRGDNPVQFTITYKWEQRE
jgi:hypothetical protein